MTVDYCGTYNSGKSKWQIWETLNNGLDWHMTFFFFVLKYLCNPHFHLPFAWLLKPCMFQSLNETWCSVGFRHPMNRIFKPEEDLNYFDKFMPTLTQNRFRDFFDVINFWHCCVSNLKYRPIKFSTFQGYPHMDHCIYC